MSPCYERHEIAPGVHMDIPHEHDPLENAEGREGACVGFGWTPPNRTQEEPVSDELNVLREENEKLRTANHNLAQRVISASDWLEEGRRELLAVGWDECAKLSSRPQLEDNPYRKPIEGGL